VPREVAAVGNLVLVLPPQLKIKIEDFPCLSVPASNSPFLPNAFYQDDARKIKIECHTLMEYCVIGAAGLWIPVKSSPHCFREGEQKVGGNLSSGSVRFCLLTFE
jgi:hypothetical protein